MSQPAPVLPLDPDTQYYRQFLHELIDMGMDLARAVHAQAKAQPATVLDATVAYDRIARAIRRTIVLAQRLGEPAPARPEHLAARRRTAARRRIIRNVENAIEHEAATDSDIARLEAELDERLDSPDLDDEIDNRPIPEIIADICRDLGLADIPGLHPWKRRTPADIADLCARAARPSAAPAPPDGEPHPTEHVLRIVPTPKRE